jgi:hypothetical protein
MLAIEVAVQKGWKKLWLETDSMLVVLAFKLLKWFLGLLGIVGIIGR